MSRKTKYFEWIRISPWVIIGSLCILVPIFTYITVENLTSQQKNMQMLLSEKGDALIRSFEAGTRTGMTGQNWSGIQVQRLIMESAKEPDILYILITDQTGNIVAHNRPSNIGKKHGSDLGKQRFGENIQWRILKTSDGKEIFEVYRQFKPSGDNLLEHMQQIFPEDWFTPHMFPEMFKNPPRHAIFVGLDMGPIEQLNRENTRQTIVVTIILALIGILGIITIIIAQNYRSTRASLSRVQALSDNLVENMPIGLLVISEDGRLTAINSTSEKLLSIYEETVIGKMASDILPLQIVGLYQDLKQEDDILSREIECFIGTKLLLFEVSAGTLRDRDENFLGSLILLRDITEIKQLKKEIERKERLASLGSLAAGVAHEIRNPLSSIKGFATYFKERYKDIPEDQKIAEIMISEVERLNRVISQLLEFARPMSLKMELTPIADIIQHSLKMIETQAHEKNIIIQREFISDNQVVSLDRDKIEQVLLNLYLNAIDSMDLNGTLTIHLNNNSNSDMITLGITDTGEGISEQNLGHIFDPYFTTKSAGTGLGLAIVHKIIEAHSGLIKVESVLGKGTTVTLSLPATKEVS
ncbi:MAG: PAS domain S-box protein [Deltaproteobacteria bacterium]|nr:PAS domain S-box protein [Deltaproteobacteria bacterium]